MGRAGRRIIREHLPLKPVWFHLLLCLSAGARHGYAIRQEVEERTEGKIRLWPTTLYGAIGQLTAAGLIEETEGRPHADDDPRRRYYRLTELGRGVLAAETERLDGLVRLARARQASGPRPRAAP